MSPLYSGETIGPPADRAYPVEPVAVERTSPSALRCADLRAVDAVAELDDAPRRAAGVHHLVKRGEALDGAVELGDLGVDRAAALEEHITRKGVGHELDLVALGVAREKRERPVVEREQRDGGKVDETCRGKERAVPAHGDDERYLVLVHDGNRRVLGRLDLGIDARDHEACGEQLGRLDGLRVAARDEQDLHFFPPSAACASSTTFSI